MAVHSVFIDTPEDQAALAQFATEEDCCRFLYLARYPDGYTCPHCKHEKGWRFPSRPRVVECADCGKQVSVTSGTILHGARRLPEWFRILYWMRDSFFNAYNVARGFQTDPKWEWVRCHKVRLVVSSALANSNTIPYRWCRQHDLPDTECTCENRLRKPDWARRFDRSARFEGELGPAPPDRGNEVREALGPQYYYSMSERYLQLYLDELEFRRIRPGVDFLAAAAPYFVHTQRMTYRKLVSRPPFSSWMGIGKPSRAEGRGPVLTSRWSE